MRVKFLSPRSPDGRLSLGSCSAAIATTSSTSSSCLGWCPGGGSRGGVSCKATSVTGAMSGRDVSTKQHGLGGTEGEMDETIEKPEQQPQQRQQQFLEFPKQLAKQILRYGDDAPIEPPMVKVRLKVHYRCFNRQMLCIGGSNIPFGWSFLSIAKVPMSWTDGDVWVTEVCYRCLSFPFHTLVYLCCMFCGIHKFICAWGISAMLCLRLRCLLERV